jgi:hypothetical protein
LTDAEAEDGRAVRRTGLSVQNASDGPGRLDAARDVGTMIARRKESDAFRDQTCVVGSAALLCFGRCRDLEDFSLDGRIEAVIRESDIPTFGR